MEMEYATSILDVYVTKDTRVVTVLCVLVLCLQHGLTYHTEQIWLTLMLSARTRGYVIELPAFAAARRVFRELRVNI